MVPVAQTRMTLVVLCNEIPGVGGGTHNIPCDGFTLWAPDLSSDSTLQRRIQGDEL